MATTNRKQMVEPSDADIVALGSYSPPVRRGVAEFVARKPFTFEGREVQRGDSVVINDARKARGMIAARLVADPLTEVA